MFITLDGWYYPIKVKTYTVTEEKFDRQVNERWNDWLKFSLKYIKNVDDAEDVLLSAVMKGRRLLENLRNRSNFEQWMLMIIKSKALDYIRNIRDASKGKYTSSDIDSPELKRHIEENVSASLTFNGGDIPGSSLDIEDIQRMVRSAVEQLPARHIRVMWFRYVLDYSYENIGKEFGHKKQASQSIVLKCIARIARTVRAEIAKREVEYIGLGLGKPYLNLKYIDSLDKYVPRATYHRKEQKPMRPEGNLTQMAKEISEAIV